MKKLIILSITIICAQILHAQSAPFSFSHYLHDGVYSFDDTFKLVKDSIFTVYKSQFGLTSYDEMTEDAEQFFRFDSSSKIDLGSIQTRYLQNHKGYPVEGKLMNTYGKCDVILAANGSVLKDADIDTAGRISETDALDSALKFIHSPIGYTWEDTNYESHIKELLDDSNATYYPTGRLIIERKQGFPDSNQYYRLCWKFDISYFDTTTTQYYDSSYQYIDSVIVYEGTDSAYTIYDTSTRYCSSITGARYITKTDTVQKKMFVYVDALTGAIHSGYNPSSGYYWGSHWTPYEGYRTAQIETYRPTIVSSFQLKDSKHINTYFLDESQNNPQITKDNDNDWINDVAEQKTCATSHWGIRGAWEFFTNRHGINYATTKEIVARVIGTDNLNRTGSAYVPGDNPPSLDQFLIEKSNSSSCNGISAAQFDILSHEYTHSIIYRSTQLGQNVFDLEATGLKEGFADIFGMLAEGWHRTMLPYPGMIPYDWSIGEHVGIVRKFDDPQYDTHLGDPTWHAYHYDWDSIQIRNNAHYASGILRKWFYALANGQNYEIFPGVHIIGPGIGIHDAEDLAFVSMMWWLWSNAGYGDAVNATLAVAETHFGGKCSPVYKAVVAAWKEVGLYAVNYDPCLVLGHGHVILHHKVIPKPKIGSETEPVLIAVMPLGTNDETTTIGGGLEPITELGSGKGYIWNLPEGWSGTYSTDSSVFTLEDVADYGSKQFSVIVADTNISSIFTSSGPGSDTTITYDTLYTVVHFSDACDGYTEGKAGHNVNTQKPSMANVKKAMTGTTLYPNPNTGSFTVNGKLTSADEKASVLVTDITGRVFLKDEVQVKDGSFSKALKLPASAPNGVYMVKVTAKSSSTVIRMIKQ